MAKRRPNKDPHASREASRYDNPIASREFIQTLLADAEKGLSIEQLHRALSIEGDDQSEALRRRLKAMLRDGQLLRTKNGRFRALGLADTISGKVQANREGFGFVLDGDGDIFLSPWQMQQVFDGDVVRVEITGLDRRGRREGHIVEVVERHTQQLVGRLRNEQGVPCVVADNPRILHPVIIEPGDASGAVEGDYVMAAIEHQPDIQRQPRGRIAEVLGGIAVPGVATEVALREHEIPWEWPEAVEEQARGFGVEPGEADKVGRVDIRHLPLVTIDGEDARDFDDAVYCERKRMGGWRLWVAIADVSHYVHVGSPLDQEATARGTSVYFPDRVVPMLPEVLSNGLCSLKPEVDRLCMVCEMTVSKSGKLSGYRFYEGLMRSHARLTYNEVGALLQVEGADPGHDSGRFPHLLPQLQNLHDLYQALRRARSQRGAIDFETVETRVVYDREHRIEAIVPVHRHDAHRLIEECMLLANVATASLLERYLPEVLFRVHRGPGSEKLVKLRSYLGELGLNLGGGDDPSPEDYQRLLEQTRTRADAGVIQVMMLRSLSQAVYQPENEGHFGLHYQAYTHFTSPIRRYPDLLVHRAIRYLIRCCKPTKHFGREKRAETLSREAIYPYDMEAMVALGEHCSMTERRADDASRDVMAWLKCEFLQERVGEEFDAVISAVTSFGMFVELEELYIEGLLHISALGKDYYHFDAAKQRLIGERSRRSFQLGDLVRVQVLRVAVEDRKIDLGLVGAKGADGGERSPVSKKAAKWAGDKKKGGKKSGKGGKEARKRPRRRK